MFLTDLKKTRIFSLPKVYLRLSTSQAFKSSPETKVALAITVFNFDLRNNP